MADEANCSRVKGLGLFERWRLRLGKLVADVPPDIARCEFECRRADCPSEQIVTCQRRMEFAEQLRKEHEPAPLQRRGDAEA